MTSTNLLTWQAWLPLLTTAISVVFALLVLQRWSVNHRTHLLLWGIGMLLFATGTAMEGLYALGGWQPWIFRLWYLSGAVLVAAWLGQWTLYLLLRGRRRRIAHIMMGILLVGSAYAAYKVFTAQLDPAGMIGGELSGGAIVSPGVRVLTPFFNSEGVVLLAGGALYSFWIFYRKRVLLNRAFGNLFIAAGALAPAIGGLLQRGGVPAALYVSELLGAILLFAGFLRATQKVPEPVRAARPAAG
jgi:hypothetical protein